MKKRQHKKKGSKRGMIFLLVIAIAAVTSSVILWNTPISEINVYGTIQYTEDEVKQLIFSDSSDQRFLSLWLKDKLGKHKNFLRITSYELEFENIHKVNVYIRENVMIGCVSYGGSYLYFDKDGVVVESRTTRLENIPIVEGLSYQEIVLGQKIKSDYDGIFQNAVRLAQILQNLGIAANSIYCSQDDNFQFVVNEISVELGDSSNLEEKVTEYYAMQEVLEGRSGTLYLDNYSFQNSNQGYIFKEKDTE